MNKINPQKRKTPIAGACVPLGSRIMVAGVQVSGRHFTRLDVRVNYPASQFKKAALFTRGGRSRHRHAGQKLGTESVTEGIRTEKARSSGVLKKVPSYATVHGLVRGLASEDERLVLET